MSQHQSPRLSFESLEDRAVPTFVGNQLFPLDNPWNQRIADAPVAANSDAIIARIVARNGGTAPRLHEDFSNPFTDGALYGMPVNVVDSRVTPFVSVYVPSSGYPGESDLVPVPIPADAVIEGDLPTGPSLPQNRGDSHLIIYDRATNTAYEMFLAARPTESQFPFGLTKPLGQWGAYQISKWDLNDNSFRTLGFTSADAAGLPILTGLVRPDEANAPTAGGVGVIDHAIRVTVRQTRDSYVFPASHQASWLSDPDLPRMGERFRLKASFVIPQNWSPEAKAIAQAMKDYGLIVADNGADFFFQGTPSDQWNMDAVRQIRAISGDAFEVVDLTPIVDSLSLTSGPTTGGTSVTLYGQNFSGAAGRLSVRFGDAEATSVTILSDSQIVAVAPAHAAGTVDVRVQSGTTVSGSPGFFGYGTSEATPATRFTFASPVSPPPASPPPPTTSAGQPFAVGTDSGSVATVTLYNPDRTVKFTARPFGDAYTGGVRVAVGDVTGDGVADVVAGSNGGMFPEARVINGATGVVGSSLLGPIWNGSRVSVAVGDVTGDGIADIAIGTDESGPHVRVYRGGDFALLSDFTIPAGSGFWGSTQVALADATGDGLADLAAAWLSPAGTAVVGYEGTTLRPGTPPARIFEFSTPAGSFGGLANLAAGDVSGDGIADLVLSSSYGTPRVVAYSGRDLVQSNMLTTAADFVAGSFSPTGVRVAVGDVTGDRVGDLLAATGDTVTAYRGGSLASVVFGLDMNLAGGLFVGASAEPSGASPPVSPPPPPPPPPPSAGRPFAVGTDSGSVATVTLYNPDRTVKFTARPFGDAYTGGVHVAVGDVTGDGVADVVAGSNGGMFPEARVIDGATGKVGLSLLGSIWNGSRVSVAVGDVTGDGIADIAIGTDESGPHVRVYRGGDFALLSDFSIPAPGGFWGLTQVALGDMTGDGKADLAVAWLAPTGTAVVGFDGTALLPTSAPSRAFEFTAPAATFSGLAYLAAGDVSGDGIADLVLSSSYGTPRVVAYSGRDLVQSNTLTAAADFVAGSFSATGVRVAVADMNGDGVGDLLTATGDTVTAYRGGSLPSSGTPPLLFDLDTGITGGLYVG